eukprot:422347_1
MSLLPGKLTKIKSRYKVVDDWQASTNEHKILNYFYRTHSKQSKPLTPKIALVLFAYLYIYKSKFSKTYRGKHIKLISETNNEYQVLNTSKANPNDYDFRGQLIRMELPLITYHNKLTFQVYFEKMPREKKTDNKNDTTNQKPAENTQIGNNNDTFIKGSIISDNNENGTVRIKITNFAKFISMNMENNDNTKSIIIEVNKSEILTKNDILNNDNNDDDKSDFETDEEDANTDSDYDENDPRYGGFEVGDPFVSGEYYFIGIISNKVETFDTDTNNYHLDGFGIDSATDYVYVGEGNNVVDTEEFNEPWAKPSILNLDKVKVECDMSNKTLTFYKNGVKFGPKDKDYTMSFDHYGVKNKLWYPAVCIVNRDVKAVFKYL